MARIRKINVSQVEGNTNGVLSAGTIAAYEVNGEYVLRVHDGVTAGGVPFPNAVIPGPYADDSAAATAGVNVGKPYYQVSGQVFVRLA
jgi:hypothetical protein